MKFTKFTLPIAFATVCLLTSHARAQGSNDCADAQLISGAGPHNFTTVGATTDGHEEGVLVTPGLRQIANDIWFRWVAPSTAIYQVNTDHVPPTDGATAVAVYKFGCPTGPGRAIAGRMGAEVGGRIWAYPSFGAEKGVEYLIRIGNTVSQNHSDGIFTIEEMSPPEIVTTAVNPGNGRTYHMLEPSSWSVARIAALQLGGDLVTVNDQAENDWLMSAFGSFAGENRSLWLGYNDAETEGTWVWANGETHGYENWSSANGPNNGNQYEHYAHMRKDRNDGTWNDLLGFPGAAFFYDEVHGVVEIVGKGGGFRITEFIYPPGNNMLTLTWASNVTEIYSVRYSSDLIDWSADLGDSFTMADDDENPDDGDHLTVTIDLSIFGIQNEPDLFFRVQKE